MNYLSIHIWEFISKNFTSNTAAVNIILLQSNEETGTKKRKGLVKDGVKKTKKQKMENGNEPLTLNAEAKCVEILHIKVITVCMCVSC